MKRRRQLSDADFARALKIKAEIVSRLPMPRLARAADAIRAGRIVDEADREFIANQLDGLYMRERAAQRDHRAAIADELARSAKIPRKWAAALVAGNRTEVPNINRAITRRRKAGNSKKGRARL